MISETAKTIFEQIGGNKVAVMTGCKFIAGEDSLTLKLPQAKYLTIKLDIGKDLYEVSYVSKRISSKTGQLVEKELNKLTDIYCDQLIGICERMTGLYFRL